MPASAGGQLQDPRLFAWRGALWCSAGVRDLTSDLSCEQMLARIDVDACAGHRLTDWTMLRFAGATVFEKNWMPCVQGGALHLIRAAGMV